MKFHIAIDRELLKELGRRYEEMIEQEIFRGERKSSDQVLRGEVVEALNPDAKYSAMSLSELIHARVQLVPITSQHGKLVFDYVSALIERKKVERAGYAVTTDTYKRAYAKVSSAASALLREV